MATSPLGGFADLTSYRKLVDAQKARNVDGLNNLIQSYIEGAQQGNTMVNLGEILQQQNQDRRNKALADQIALQLRGIQLNEAQNPDLALDRTLRAALSGQAATPGTGIIASPIGLEASTIATPGAITAEQQAALESGAKAIPTAALGASIVPVTGVSGAPTGFSQDMNRAIAESALMSRAKGANTSDIAAMRNESFLQGLQAKEVMEKEKIASREKIAATRGGGKLTESQKLSIFQKAGKSGIDPDDDKYKDESGNIDFRRVMFDAGRAEKSAISEKNQAKLGQLTGEAKTQAGKYYSALEDLDALKLELQTVASTSTEPGFMDKVIASTTKSSPEGVLGAAYQILAKSAQSDASKELEATKDRVSSTILNALSGAAVTPAEAGFTSSFRPTSTDSLKDLIRKASQVEDFINNKLSGINRAAGISDAASPTSTTQSSGIPTVTTKQQYDALPSGSPYIDRNGKRSTKR